jgi:DNA-binding NtrC family response regulator
VSEDIDLTTWPHGTLEQIERHAITAAVKRFGAQEAAKVLGIGKTTVYRKLSEYRKDAQLKPRNGVA